MSSQILITEFCCSDCNVCFESATTLLIHFAVHVNQVCHGNRKKRTKKKNVPDLYPILKNQLNANKNEEINPFKCCIISVEDVEEQNETIFSKIDSNLKSTKKKYRCSFCSKIFGWSTDLKRHILIHTGERPFKCQLCNATFTRNFLLQKHQSKIHHTDEKRTKQKMPSLKPILTKLSNVVKAKDSRKQNKQKIKRNYLSKPNKYCETIYSTFKFFDKETVMQ